MERKANMYAIVEMAVDNGDPSDLIPPGWDKKAEVNRNKIVDAQEGSGEDPGTCMCLLNPLTARVLSSAS